MIADRLRASILQAAISGQLTDRCPEDGILVDLVEKIADARAELSKGNILKKQKTPPEVSENEEPFVIPDNWNWVRLGVIGMVNPRVEASDNAVVGFLPMAAIEDGYSGKIAPETRHWKEVKSGYTKFSIGDVVLAKITPCFQNRKSAVIRGTDFSVGAGTTELHVIRPFSVIQADYLLWILKSEYVQNALVPSMTGTAGQKRVQLTALRNLPIPLPPSEEQVRIVAKLDEVMPLIDQLAGLEKERESI